MKLSPPRKQQRNAPSDRGSSLAGFVGMMVALQGLEALLKCHRVPTLTGVFCRIRSYLRVTSLRLRQSTFILKESISLKISFHQDSFRSQCPLKKGRCPVSAAGALLLGFALPDAQLAAPAVREASDGLREHPATRQGPFPGQSAASELNAKCPCSACAEGAPPFVCPLSPHPHPLPSGRAGAP